MSRTKRKKKDATPKKGKKKGKKKERERKEKREGRNAWLETSEEFEARDEKKERVRKMEGGKETRRVILMNRACIDRKTEKRKKREEGSFVCRSHNETARKTYKKTERETEEGQEEEDEGVEEEGKKEKKVSRPQCHSQATSPTSLSSCEQRSFSFFSSFSSNLRLMKGRAVSCSIHVSTRRVERTKEGKENLLPRFFRVKYGVVPCCEGGRLLFFSSCYRERKKTKVPISSLYRLKE